MNEQRTGDSSRRVHLSLLTALGALVIFPGIAFSQESTRTRDAFGDPLPPGALRRLGTVRNCYLNQMGISAQDQPLPDGKAVLTSMGNQVRRVDIETGRLVDTWALPSGWYVTGFSPDGRLALLADPHAFHLGDLKTRKVVRKFVSDEQRRTESARYSTSARFSLDNKMVATHDAAEWRETTWRFWDVASGHEVWQEVRKLKRPRDPAPWLLGFLPDGKTLLLTDYPTLSPISVRDRTTGREQRAFTTAVNQPGWNRLTPDGKSLLIAEGKSVRVWDVPTGAERPALVGHEHPVRIFAVSPDSRTVLTGGDDPYVLVWDLPSGKQRTKIDLGPVGGVHSRMIISADGKRAVIMVWNMQLRSLDLENGKELPAPAEAHRDAVNGLAITPDGKLVSAGRDNTIRVWDYSSGKQLQVYRTEHRYGVEILALSADGRLIASAVGKKVFFYERDTGRLVRTIETETGPLAAIAFAPKGHLLAAIRWGRPDEDGKPNLTLWDAETGKERHRLRVENAYKVLTFHPDGRLLATVGDRRARIWDVTDGRERPGPPTTDSVLLAFSPDGRVLVSADRKGISMWELASGKERGRIEFESPSENADIYLPCLRFSPDGKWLAWGIFGSIDLADVQRGRRVHSFTGHESLVTGLEFAPDSRTLASSSYDTTVLIWDVAGVAARQPKPQGRPDLAAGTTAWADLASPDAKATFRAIQLLAEAPEQSVKLLREQLKPAWAADAKQIAHLVAGLDSKNFAEREKAVRALERLGEEAEAALRPFLTRNPSPDARRRAEGLLSRVGGPVNDPELLRSLRAMEVLEAIRTPEARRVMETLAQGDPPCQLTREARAALERWAQSRTPGGP